MTIKEATQQIIRECRTAEMMQGSWQFRIYDKQIAEHIGITATALSRISTGVTAPDIKTFEKILQYAATRLGEKRTLEILRNVFDTNTNTERKQSSKSG